MSPTRILFMQSAVPYAFTHERRAKAVTAAGGRTATSALASSAHFLCSGSDTVHQRIFLPECRHTGILTEHFK